MATHEDEGFVKLALGALALSVVTGIVGAWMSPVPKPKFGPEKLCHSSLNRVGHQLVACTTNPNAIGKSSDVRELWYAQYAECPACNYDGFTVISCEEIVNLDWFQAYERKKSTLSRGCEKTIRFNTNIADLPLPKLESDINEGYLIYACGSYEVLSQIRKSGFRPTHPRNGLYGVGCYFAEDVTKADYYVDPDHEYIHLILARVCMGEPFHTTKPLNQGKPPGYPQNFQSTLGGITETKAFREFVVYDPELAYPQYIFTLRRNPRFPTVPPRPVPENGLVLYISSEEMVSLHLTKVDFLTMNVVKFALPSGKIFESPVRMIFPSQSIFILLDQVDEELKDPNLVIRTIMNNQHVVISTKISTETLDYNRGIHLPLTAEERYKVEHFEKASTLPIHMQWLESDLLLKKEPVIERPKLVTWMSKNETPNSIQYDQDLSYRVWMCATENDIQQLEALNAYMPYLNINQVFQGKTALDLAVQHRNLYMIQYFCQFGAITYGKTAEIPPGIVQRFNPTLSVEFYVEASKNNLLAMETLLKQESTICPNVGIEGFTPLDWAIAHENEEMVRLLCMLNGKTFTHHQSNLNDFGLQSLGVLVQAWPIDQTFDWVRTIIPLVQAKKLRDEQVDGQSLLLLSYQELLACGLSPLCAQQLKQATQQLATLQFPLPPTWPIPQAPQNSDLPQLGIILQEYFVTSDLSVQVLEVAWCENAEVWNQYTQQKKKIQMITPPVPEKDRLTFKTSKIGLHNDLDKEYNEAFLFYDPSESPNIQIGLNFTEGILPVMNDAVCEVFLCRVCLGQPHFTSEAGPASNVLLPGTNSVVASKPARRFIIYDQAQSYPQLRIKLAGKPK